MGEYKERVINYFRDKAEEYDLVDDQIYWVLSDNLLWKILKDNALDKLDEEFSFVDAGGGTARWTVKILEEYKKSTGKIIDLSEDMLIQAKQKIIKKSLNNRVKVEQADLDKYEIKQNDKYDIAFSFHNVLGFVKNPKNVMKKMYDMVNEGGYVVALTPNLYHNIYFNIYVDDFKLAKEAYEEGRGKFTSDMPAMHMFTPQSLRNIYNEIGIEIVGVYGFPITIYPGMQETQLRGETKKLENILNDEEKFNFIFNTELQLYKNEDAAGRGNQIIIIGRKKSK